MDNTLRDKYLTPIGTGFVCEHGVFGLNPMDVLGYTELGETECPACSLAYAKDKVQLDYDRGILGGHEREMKLFYLEHCK